jgi:tripartite-type tricarboxylate transporter receptor subunit TctC
MITRRNVAATPLVLAALGAGGVARAQDVFPTSPVRLIVPFAAGGSGDIVARILGDRAAAELGQPVIIENRSGGNGVIGSQAAARARPDGHTLLQITAAALIITTMQDNLPYSLERDFVPIVGVGSFPTALATSGRSNIRSVQDLVAVARSRPGGITYASGGVGSLGHLAAARLVNELRIPATHIPYRGSHYAMQALLSDEVQFFFGATADVVALHGTDRIRVLGVTSPERVAGLRDVPTMAELGFAEFNASIWFGYLAPTGTPAAAVEQLRTAFANAVRDPAVQQRFAPYGFAAVVQPPAEFSRFIRSEAGRWGQVIRDNNITIGN